LAESWESSKNSTVWRFKLRKGVEFSNGKSLTPEDVITSLNVHRSTDSTSAGKPLISMVNDITADGSDGGIFKLDYGMVNLPAMLCAEFFNICPSKDSKPDMSGVGAGPYIIKEFQPGVRAVLERNPNSYKSGNVDSAELAGVADAAARQAALISGSAD